MTTESREPEGWTESEERSLLYRRFEFAAYRQTKGFLDRLADLSKETGLYPDLSFGTTYVNVTVYGSERCRYRRGGSGVRRTRRCTRHRGRILT